MLTVAALPTLDHLRQYVRQLLCERDRLDPTATPLQEALLSRRNQPCGRLFSTDGPRGLRTYAVWAEPENRLLFYDCTGARYAEVRLSEAPVI